MTARQKAPHGAWKSPITPDLVAAAALSFGQIAVDGGDIYWIEHRPAEGGRHVIVRRAATGTTADVTPPPFNARTRVHEYGGGAFTVHDGVVYFSNYADQRLYRRRLGRSPEPITPADAFRYADTVVDYHRDRLLCIREDHTVPQRPAVNTVVGINLQDENAGTILIHGNDFYASPRISPDGSQLAWLTWRHPNMPWDGTELWVGGMGPDGVVVRRQRVAGGPEESIFQPEWSPDGTLHFVSDRTGWWNLYRWKTGVVVPLCKMDAEFGRAQWLLGMSTYAFESADQILCTYNSGGRWLVGRLDAGTGTLEPLELPYTDLLPSMRVAGTQAVLGASSPSQAVAIVRLDLPTGQPTVLRQSPVSVAEPAWLSQPRAIEFQTKGGLTAHGIFYPPKNPDYTPPARKRPPLLVMAHGGPTGAASTAFSPAIQFWTSRGFAVLDVNYGGSTNYGRAYRQRLNGMWGIVDVDDCVNGAEHLVRQRLVDPERLAIRGGSAGGYTTLAAIAFKDVFRAGAAYYGISDLEVFAKETHKFESRYLDRLVGPYPQHRDRYVARSPIHQRLSCPVIFFQGLEDAVVPPNESERMYQALRDKGVATAYLAFEGEQHGFRRADTIRRCLEAELYFYARVFGIELADPVDPVPIDNL